MWNLGQGGYENSMSKMPRQKRGDSRQDYETPNELLDAVRDRLSITQFSADLAASEDNAKANLYFTEEQDSLKQSWHSVSLSSFDKWCWLNPPFANIEPWVKKAAEESFLGAHIATLVPASVGANWWREWVEAYAYVSFLNGRVTFDGCTTPYPKDCAILLYTPWGFTGSECWNWRSK